MEKRRGMAFGFRKTATAVKKPDRFIYLFIHQLVSKIIALQGASMTNCGMYLFIHQLVSKMIALQGASMTNCGM
jgi:hypothetical protein